MIISLWTSDVPSRQKILSYRQYVLIMSLISSWRSDPGTLGLHRHHMECWAKNSWSLSTTSGSPKLCLFFFDALVQRRSPWGVLKLLFQALFKQPSPFQTIINAAGILELLHFIFLSVDEIAYTIWGPQAARRAGGQAGRRPGSRIVIVFTNI